MLFLMLINTTFQLLINPKKYSLLPELKKTQVFHRIVQIGLYFTNERHFEGKLGFLELLSIKFESFSQ